MLASHLNPTVNFIVKPNLDLNEGFSNNYVTHVQVERASGTSQTFFFQILSNENVEKTNIYHLGMAGLQIKMGSIRVWWCNGIVRSIRTHLAT